jgi:acetyl esterase
MIKSDIARCSPLLRLSRQKSSSRDEGEAYSDALRRAGVDVQYTCHRGMIHHFYCMDGAIPYARTAIKSAGVAIKEAPVESN